MKPPPSFRRFLLIMVFLLEGLSLTVVIGYLFAMLDRSLQQEQVAQIQNQQAELRHHLTNRLEYTHTRAREIGYNNNIKISLLLGMTSKLADNLRTHFPQTMGSTFYVRSSDGLYTPQPEPGHHYLNDPRLLPQQPGEATEMAVKPHAYVYLTPIIQQDRVIGHAVGVYDPYNDLHAAELVEADSHLSLVYKQGMQVTDLFTQRPLAALPQKIAESLSRQRYQHASDDRHTLLMAKKEFPSLYLLVNNQPYRQQRWSMVVKLVMLCVPILVMTFTFSFLILRRVTCALNTLAKNALHIAQTDGHSDLDTTQIRHAEFLDFTQAFNKLLNTVRQQTGDLKRVNENLQKQIEERLQIGDALKESEAQLRSLQDNIPIGLLRRTVDGRLVFANPKVVSIFGYGSEEEMIQVPIRQLYDNPVHYDDVMGGFEADENIQRLELPLKRRDGTRIWGDIHLKRTVDPKSGSAYIDAAIIDITARKKIEKDKERLEIQLRQAHKMEALGTLAGGIAHDFNNILFAIIGYCELALEEAASGSQQMGNLELAIAGAHRASDLVRQILTFARQTEMDTQPINFAPIVKESLKLLRATIPTSIDIRTNLDANVTVLADPTQLHQLILNLCTNACHAMQNSGGELTITVTSIHVSTGNAHRVPGLAEGRYAWFRVKDTGHGIPPETLERIFDPYFTTKSKGEGSGMGLSVVQGIVKSLSGVIVADSVVGEGSTFNIYLPAQEESDAVAHEHQNAIVGGKEHILFVDDELLLTGMMSQMLSKMGYEVTTYNNPLSALEAFRYDPGQFDLVISDITMPKMTGPEMIREMMQIRPGLPALLCTGYSESVNEKMASNPGVHALMHKPLVRHELSATIRSALDTRSAA